MAIDASDLLGWPQQAGVNVNARGFGKARGAAASGGFGGLVGALIGAGRSQRAAKQKQAWTADSQTPDFGRFGFLALGSDELALIRLKSGVAGLKPEEVVVRVPRTNVGSIDLSQGGTTAPLTVTLTSGETWALEVPAVGKKRARALIEALGVPPAISR